MECHAPPPTEVKINKVTLQELNSKYRNALRYNDPRRDYNFFIKGMIETKNIEDRKLIINISSYDLETVVHEAMHYCVHYLFKNIRINDQESATFNLTREFLLSPQLQDFIQRLGR